VIDDRNVLARLADISSAGFGGVHPENFDPTSRSRKEELRRKKVGILGTMFPAAWTTPGADFGEVAP